MLMLMLKVILYLFIHIFNELNYLEIKFYKDFVLLLYKVRSNFYYYFHLFIPWLI